jgi:hypothetical protein
VTCHTIYSTDSAAERASEESAAEKVDWGGGTTHSWRGLKDRLELAHTPTGAGHAEGAFDFGRYMKGDDFEQKEMPDQKERENFQLTILLQKKATVCTSGHPSAPGTRREREKKERKGGREGGRIWEKGGTTYHLATTTGMYPQTYSFPLASAVETCTLAYFKLSFKGRPNTTPGGAGTYSGPCL